MAVLITALEMLILTCAVMVAGLGLGALYDRLLNGKRGR